MSGPVAVDALPRRTIERLRSGSSDVGIPNSGFGVTVRPPGGNAISNFTSREMTRPSEVPRR